MEAERITDVYECAIREEVNDMIGYRSEQLYGEGYRDAAPVMAHEVFELQNTDVLDTLSSTILKDSSCRYDMERLSKCIGDDNNEDSEMSNFLDNAYDDESLGIEYFRNVLDAIKNVTGKDIKYVLWLCDSVDNIIKEYGESLDEFDAYDTSDIVISNMGKAGKLYGYESAPVLVQSIRRLL